MTSNNFRQYILVNLGEYESVEDHRTVSNFKGLEPSFEELEEKGVNVMIERENDVFFDIGAFHTQLKSLCLEEGFSYMLIEKIDIYKSAYHPYDYKLVMIDITLRDPITNLEYLYNYRKELAPDERSKCVWVYTRNKPDEFTNLVREHYYACKAANALNEINLEFNLDINGVIYALSERTKLAVRERLYLYEDFADDPLYTRLTSEPEPISKVKTTFDSSFDED